MSAPATKRPFYILFFNNLLKVCAGLAVLNISCNSPKQDNVEYSREFQPILDSSEQLFKHEKFEAALHYVDSASAKLSGLSSTEQLRRFGIHYVYYNKIKHNNEAALLYADSMIAAASKIKKKERYISGLADAYFARGDALFELGRYSESYADYYQGYLLAFNNFDNCTLSAYQYRMGMITYKQGNFRFAVNYFKLCFKNNTSFCKDDFVSFFRRQEVLDNIGLAYKNLNKLDSAAHFFNATINFLDRYGSKYKERAELIEVAHAVVYGNQADILNIQGKTQEAVVLLKKNISINLKRGNDKHDAHLSEIKLAELYLKLDKEELALPLLNAVRLQLDSLPAADAEAAWSQTMSKYYQQRNDMLKAFIHAERYHRITDSLAAVNRVLKGTNVNEQLGNLQKQSQILSLQTTQRISIYGGVIFFCMLMIIILLIYRNWKRSRQKMAIVSSLNTQIMQQKDDLERTLADLKNSSQEKDRILHTVAHDLRNPLGGIASLTEAIADDTKLTDEQKELLKLIRETAQDSLQLINEILEATINSPAIELTKQSVDINALISNSVELMRFKAAEKKQNIVLSTLSKSEFLVISREKIWRVMSNLISNAIKFSKVGANIEVLITDVGQYIQISVSDQGIGIPAGIKDMVFNMFTPAKRVGTLGEKSFGLGLSICRQIIDNHQGKIWFENNPNGGTIFYVKLPKGTPPANNLT